MYSQDKIKVALKVYHQCGSVTTTIRVLGYPTRVFCTFVFLSRVDFSLGYNMLRNVIAYMVAVQRNKALQIFLIITFSTTSPPSIYR